MTKTLLADRYRLEELVASGGMGEVWRATDTLLKRNVAVKLMRSSHSEDRVVAERFRREALLAAQLSHPNMAGVYDYVQEHGRPGIVMEYVEGTTLAERLARDDRLGVGETVRVASGVLSALQAAHAAGIVHRDIKPGNVMLTRAGEVKVTDFGIARQTGDLTLTDTGMVIGTAHYLSPEQARGKPATPGSDLYSVGAVLYEMLSGSKPFEAETPLAVAMRRLTEDPAPLRSVRPDVPDAVERVVTKAMARNPEQRFPSAEAMRSELENAVATAGPATAPRRTGPAPTEVLPVAPEEAETTVLSPRAPAPSPRKPAAPRRRPGEHRRLFVSAVLVGLVIGLIAILVLALSGRESTIQVPTFTGRSLTQARQLASAGELDLRVQRVQSDRAKDLVLDQNPSSGIRVALGETVVLTVSSGVPPQPADVEVPDLAGLKEGEAKDRLEAEGLELGRTFSATSETVEEGRVIRSIPAAGDTVQRGDEVDIVVSSGPPRKRGKGRGNG